MNKKGNVFDSAYVAIYLFAGAMVVITGAVAWNQISPNLKQSFKSDLAQDVLVVGDNIYPQFDYVYLGLIIGLIIFVVMSAMLVKTHPIFFVMSIIVLAIVGVITPQMSNAFSQFRSQEAINTTSSDFPIVNYTMNNLPLIICIVGIVIIIFLYGKPNDKNVQY